MNKSSIDSKFRGLRLIDSLNQRVSNALLASGVSFGERIILGFSGGPDSLCLFDILTSLDFPFVAAYFSHGMRPPQEIEDERKFIRIKTQQYKIPLEFGEVDVPDFAGKEGLSLETAARILRYRFLFRTAEKYCCKAVLVAHTANDQGETILMHFLRGSGLTGLKGMDVCQVPNAWHDEIKLIRPLLTVWRTEIEDYCRETGLTPQIDSSNDNRSFLRNRIRSDVIPYLESINPNVQEAILRIGDISSVEDAFLGTITKSYWENSLKFMDLDHIQLDSKAFRASPTAIQRRLVRTAILSLSPENSDFDYQTVLRVVDGINRGMMGFHGDISQGLSFMLDNKSIWFTKDLMKIPAGKYPQLETESTLELDVPGYAALGSGWMLTSELQMFDPQQLYEIPECHDLNIVWLSADHLELPLIIRRRAPGDRFSPLGLGNVSTNLADFMTNQKIPFRVRSDLPLVCSGNDIIWIAGNRIHHRFRVTPDTKQILKLEVAKPKR